MTDMPPASTPCINVCVVDPLAGLCVGCGRTVAEISLWPEMDEPARQSVMAALPARLLAARSRGSRGGRVRRPT
jgi:predicted Fe-S protein YdhL (DUF1289 family)